jgi:hypothetical protein
MVPGPDTPDEELSSNKYNPPSPGPSSPPEPSPKPLLRRISESLESRKQLLRTWSLNNIQSLSQNSPSFLEKLSVWTSTPAVNSTQEDERGEGDVAGVAEKQEEEVEVEIVEDSSEEDIPLPDPKTMSLSRRSNIVSFNSKLQRSVSSLSLFRAPRVRRKRNKDKLGKGIHPQPL